MLAEIRAGQTQLSDGTIAPARATRMGGIVVGDGQGRYYEQAARGNIFSLILTAWSTTIAAGNIVGAAAAASTQFALWNPSWLRQEPVATEVPGVGDLGHAPGPSGDS